MDYKKLIIRGISYSQTQSGAYALLLEDEETGVKLPIVIGNLEAQSISIGLEKDIHPPRPLTHDLFAKFVKSAGFELVSVVIYKILDGVFFSNINLKNGLEEMVLDSRTSDAVAMAVRFDAPIYTTSVVMNEAGILLDLDGGSDAAEGDAEAAEGDLYKMSMAELQSLIDDAVKNEDFDSALEIQNELRRRNKKID